jgi:hypothetical protein
MERWPLAGLEGAIEDRQVLVAQIGRALDGLVLVDVLEDLAIWSSS